MKYLSLFSGIGGFELGIGSEHENIGFSEIDKYAVQIYQKHFPDHKNHGDITKLDPAIIPDFDLLCGGFPCQSFSIAGKRRGFSDTRGTLFFNIADILRAKKPRLFLLENVKGLLSHDNGRTFATIISTIDELGYDCQWQVLNSKDFGVPQNRERVFIAGHIRGTPRPKVFPLEADSRSDIVLPTLTARYWGAQANGGYIGTKQTKIGTFRTHKDGNGFREVKSGLCPTIPARAREDGSGQPVIIQRPRGKNKGGEHAIAPTMTGKSYPDNNHVGGVRRLTPTECERLQGFPDSWTAGVSDTQRYKCLGNAVTVNVIREICKKLL
ncbi:MAG: DNA (cytosine-5-)-methyltransferase [Patescibacteria group bacterium]